MPGHLNISAQMPTFNTFEMKQSFWKSIKYLWRYRIFATKVYMLKVGNFKSFRWAKFSPCHCKSKIRAHVIFSDQMPTFNTFKMKQSFWKWLNTFGDIGYLLVRFTGWKWKISNLVDGLSFHVAIAQVKYPGTWTFQPKCPLSTRLRWSKVFENRLNTFGDIGFLGGQFTGWKWEISNLFDGLSSHLAIAKVKSLRTWTFRSKWPLSTRLRWSEVFENRLNTFGDIGYLLVRFTGCKWKISNLFAGLSFHVAIAKVKYLGTWTFQPKCPLSTRLRWSKVFENRLNTFGDIGFWLRQFTGWKWEISNLFDGGKKPISPKVFNRFSKTLLHLQRVQSGHLGRKFRVPRHSTFAVSMWKLSATTSFEISHF